MVQFYRKTHEYAEPPSTTILAFFLRYPNPFARHVLSVDVLSRRVDPTTGQIYTQRLIVKRGILPKWAVSWIPGGSGSSGRGGLDAWVLEESVVDPPGWDMPGSEGIGESSRAGAAGGVYGIGYGWNADKGRGNTAEQDAPAAAHEASASSGEPRLRAEQANLNHKRVMHVVEGAELTAGPSGTTIHHTTAQILSSLGGAWSTLIRSKVESWGLGKFERNTERAREGMSNVLTRLRTRQPVPDTAEFYPPPPPGFGETWPGAGGVTGQAGTGAGAAAAAGAGAAATSREGAGAGVRGPVGFVLSPESLQRIRRPGDTAGGAVG